MVRAVPTCVGQTSSSEDAALQQLNAIKPKKPTKAHGEPV